MYHLDYLNQQEQVSILPTFQTVQTDGTFSNFSILTYQLQILSLLNQ